MADLPFEPADAGSTQRLLRAVDAEGKIPRGLEAYGPIGGRDVVMFGASSERARWLTAAGARLRVVADPASERDQPPKASADVVIAFWVAFDGPDGAELLARAQRILRPDGRLLVVLDYGRDELDVVRGPDRTADLVAWSRRDGWFLSRGFRIRVLHTFWRFGSLEEGGELLRAAFGPAAEPAIERLRRPRLAHNVAVYHWTREAAASRSADGQRAARVRPGPGPGPRGSVPAPDPRKIAPPAAGAAVAPSPGAAPGVTT